MPAQPYQSRQIAALRLALPLTLALLLAACGGSGGGNDNSTNDSAPALSPAAALGEKIFADQSLSASGQMACATCHDPDHAHASNPAAGVVPAGGAGLNVAGFRNTPTLSYISFTPAFYFDAEGTPTGGFARDGRATDLIAQAEAPFLSAHEMANGDAAGFVAKLRNAAYVAEFQQVFGAAIFDDADTAFQRARFAVAQYEKEDADFRPFDSKFDYFLAGKATLTAQELRGYALFNSPTKGNCAGCHPSGRNSDGTPPLFTDFTYDNLGVPRNTAIPATTDPAYFDLGLCGPDRTDLSTRTDLCGAFKVPTLRNVALTAPYFHNGKFATLREVVEFYVRRDTNPELWYPVGASGIEKFNDLPPAYRANVNTSEAPYNRQLGDNPALDDDEIDAVVAFLNTLTDGYQR